MCPTRFINISGEESLKCAVVPLHTGASWVGGYQVCVCETVVKPLITPLFVCGKLNSVQQACIYFLLVVFGLLITLNCQGIEFI